jgi:hypothetical protein
MFYLSNDNISFKDCLPHHILWFFYPRNDFIPTSEVCLLFVFFLHRMFLRIIYVFIRSFFPINPFTMRKYCRDQRRTTEQTGRLQNSNNSNINRNTNIYKRTKARTTRTRDTMTETNGFECV